MKTQVILALTVLLCVSNAFRFRFLPKTPPKILPVAVFHGLGDSCKGVKWVVDMLAQGLGTHVVCIETGAGKDSMIKSMKSQAKAACEGIKADSKFNGEFAVIGLSQGGLLARSIIEQCDMIGLVKKYIAVGTPQMGVASIPASEKDSFLKTAMKKLATDLAYFGPAQSTVGPAGYFKDPKHINKYLEHSSFLADLNNERPKKNPNYVNRMKQLEKVMLIKFAQDEQVNPPDSAHFLFVDQNGKVVPEDKSDFYTHDFIGMNWLEEKWKVLKKTYPGTHLAYDDQHVREWVSWLKDEDMNGNGGLF